MHYCDWQALHYAEVLARVITFNPQLFPAAMAQSLYQLADKLRFCDPQRLLSDEAGEPEWLQHLAAVIQAMQVCNLC
jgi:hypothetical protein